MDTETGRLRVRMAQDEIFHCYILVFVSKKSRHNYQGESIRIDCVEYTKVDETIEKLSQNNYGFIELTRCRSPPIFIEDGERIRISLSGGMKLPLLFHKSHMLITFLREGLHKHIIFPVETRYGNRPSCLGYIDFKQVRGGLIHQAFFDVDFPFGKETLRGLPGTCSSSASHASSTPDDSVMSVIYDRTVSLDASVQRIDPGTHHLMVPNIILTLTKALPANEWKFIFRAICVADGSEINADDIISEAEQNNPGNVREVKYQSLQNWADKKDFRTPRDMLDTLIQRLETGENRRVAYVLKQSFNA
ncbi:uncharacterized protein [Argopecten irradians]|uniref:uncharacterized protein n=1 Tax=Argopecten irradians TaxID=31199 RepID=UPI0037176DD0